MSTTGYTLALDIGGTKIAYGLVADESPTEVIGFVTLPSQPVNSSAPEQVAAALRAGVASGLPISRVGIGAPGIVRGPQGDIVYNGPTMPGWAGTNLRGMVADLVGAPLACHNDVRTWAYGEQRLGVGRQFPTGRVLYVSLGTGVGGAIVSDGELIDSPTGAAGEISELVAIDFAGMADRAEAIASGPGMARYYAHLNAAEGNVSRMWFAPEPEPITFHEVMQAAAAGDTNAQQIIAGNSFGLGRCLGAIATAWDLSAIVLGGGVVNASAEVVSFIREGISSSALPPVAKLPVLIAEAAAQAPLIGAAAYARDFAF